MGIQTYPDMATQAEIDALEAEKAAKNIFILTGLTANSANTDVGTFTGLPAKYVIRRITVFDASINLTTATIDVRTAADGAGTALVSAQVLSALTAAAKYADCTLEAVVGTDYRTNASLIVRNVTAQGATATFSIALEIEPLV